MRLTRRRLAALVPGGLLLSLDDRLGRAASVLPARNLAFTVWRKGERIGTHTVRFDTRGDAVTVTTAAHFSVGLGPVNLYSYDYHVREEWQGGKLTMIAATTNDNGTRGTCTASRRGGALAVAGSKSGRYLAPHGSIAGTHWNKAEIAAPMINPENGVLMRFAVSDKGMDPPPGGGAAAHHYALTGFATLDLWYDATSTWVGLRAVAKDGSVVEYRRA